MNERAMNLLEQYDMNLKGISKGRGTLICDTDKGMCVLKPYTGSAKKLELLKRLQERFSDNLKTDFLIPAKTGELFVKDTFDNTSYILTSRLDGKECSYKSEDDIIRACAAMARLHLRLMTPIVYEDGHNNCEMTINFFADEMERHTIECKRIYNYLRKKKTKNDFERELFNEYGYFLEKAIDVTNRAKQESKAEYEAYVKSNRLYCHGDFQYHNVLFSKSGTASYTGIINMEHITPDAGARDFYLFFRKVCQKYDWSPNIAFTMLEAYQSRRTFPPIELRSLKLMLEYPEKFWKITDHYYNTKKSLISIRNTQKLENLIEQEKNKEKLIDRMFNY